MKLTTKHLQQIIKEEVTAALNEALSRDEPLSKDELLLRNAIKEWMTETGFEPEDRVDLEVAAKEAAKTPRPNDRHPAFQKIMGIGGPWGTGPELEYAIKKISYEIMGGEKPEYTQAPEDKETPAQQRAREEAVRSINRKMGGKYKW